MLSPPPSYYLPTKIKNIIIITIITYLCAGLGRGAVGRRLSRSGAAQGRHKDPSVVPRTQGPEER